LEAIAAVRTLRRAFVYSRDAVRRRDFADRMSARLQVDVQPAEQPAAAVRNLPVMITATASRTPVFDARDVADGALICAIGSNWLDRAEIDPNIFGRVHAVVCDSVAACRHEAGDLALAADAGKFDWSSAMELGNFVAGKTEFPHSASGITIFKSVGLAIEDVALGAVILERAIGHE
jgi:ornithine cyclodeaminase/alanine dehydrogenase-like protein (mu-crystallin family)